MQTVGSRRQQIRQRRHDLAAGCGGAKQRRAFMSEAARLGAVYGSRRWIDAAAGLVLGCPAGARPGSACTTWDPVVALMGGDGQPCPPAVVVAQALFRRGLPPAGYEPTEHVCASGRRGVRALGCPPAGYCGARALTIQVDIWARTPSGPSNCSRTRRTASTSLGLICSASSPASRMISPAGPSAITQSVASSRSRPN